MGKKGVTKYDNYFTENQLYGKWLVLSNKLVIEKEAKVLCKCTECNVTERYVPALQLINGVSKRCSVCGYSNKNENNPAWKGYKEIPYSWFSKYFERNQRKRFGDITIKDVYDLWIKQNKKCSLSGLDIDFIKRENGVSASIDRVDSKKEYVINNIQLVHKDVNLMKNHFQQEYFINMCERIVNEKRSKINQ